MGPAKIRENLKVNPIQFLILSDKAAAKLLKAGGRMAPWAGGASPLGVYSLATLRLGSMLHLSFWCGRLCAGGGIGADAHRSLVGTRTVQGAYRQRLLCRHYYCRLEEVKRALRFCTKTPDMACSPTEPEQVCAECYCGLNVGKPSAQREYLDDGHSSQFNLLSKRR